MLVARFTGDADWCRMFIDDTFGFPGHHRMGAQNQLHQLQRRRRQDLV